jgi:hypothetical protein
MVLLISTLSKLSFAGGPHHMVDLSFVFALS